MQQSHKAYRDMFTLMREEPEAKMFYEELPFAVKEEMQSRAFRVNSFDNMRSCADFFLHKES